MTTCKALKALYYAIVGSNTTKNSVAKVLKDLADNWPEEFTKAAAELPTVTADNNGAVLKVSGGAWAIGSDTDTTGIPAYTSSNAGNVLSVNAQGELVWVDPEAGAEGATGATGENT